MGIHSVGTSDAALVRRVQAGDTAAYADLVARYRDRLGRYALHMLGNREDAEEVLQDAFVRAYRSLARCDDPERFGAWLYGILVNRCRTAGARAARRARRFAGDARDHHGPTARRRHATGSDVALAQAPPPGHAHTARWACGGGRPRRRRPPLPDGLPIARSPAGGVARLSVRPRRSPRDARIARRRLQRLGCDPHTDAPGRKRSAVDRGGAARSRALSLRVLRGRRALAGRPLGARGPRRGLRRTQLGADRGRRGLMTSDLTRTALPLLAAILLAGAAASQQTDPRLERLDAGTRPIVAALVDSAHRAFLPTEPLVQRALEGATKRASGDLIVAAVRRLAVDLGRARDALGSTASPAELSAG